MKLRSLGDTVLMTAPLEQLTRAFPNAELHVAVSARWASLLENFPGVKKVWTYERHREKPARAKALARLALNLRKERFDMVLNFHASPSSATLAFATGARTRSIHFHGHRDRNRYSTVTVPGKGILKPIIERDMDAVRAIGVVVPAGSLPKIHLTDPEKTAAAQWLSDQNLSGPVLALGLGASRPSKSWPPERFAQLALDWCRGSQGSVLATVAHEDAESVEAFQKALETALESAPLDPAERSRLRSRILIVWDLPLRKLAGVLSQIAVFAGNDSGPKHLALAAGAPTVTVFGPEDPYEWHPYPRDRHPLFYIENLPCRRDALPGFPPWCGVHLCLEEKHRCMKQISSDEVLRTCERLIGNP